ncbi:MAG: hypothetical protein DMG32_02285 [Acidobacteria bacterium]|nr:MAG: hypothetical protein DMG32_02285 [Acidobacteriota bacterium]
MRFRSSFLLAFIFLVSAAAAAQRPPQRDPQALLIIQKSLAAMGGAAAAAGVTDTDITGSLKPSSGSFVEAGTFRWQTAGSEFRYEKRAGSSIQVLVSGHGHPANIRNGTVTPLSLHTALANPPLHLPALILADVLANQGYSVTLLGKTTVNGVAAIKVHISLDTDLVRALVTPQDWYFNATTGLPSRVEHRLPDNAHPQTYANGAEEFSNFQLISGVLVPFTIVAYEEGVQVAGATVNSIKFNQGINPSEFDAPQGGAQ